MYWDWKIGGVILGLTFLVAVALVKPIGVSTQFVILNGIIADVFNQELVTENENNKSGYGSINPYLDKSGGKYAKSVAKPLNYSFIFVISMFLGAFIGRLFTKTEDGKIIKQVPVCHQQRFGDNIIIRYVLTFTGGLLVLWGARLAGGCTSGHMMSGMMQTAISGYMFALAAFVVAIPVAIFLYRR